MITAPRGRIFSITLWKWGQEDRIHTSTCVLFFYFGKIVTQARFLESSFVDSVGTISSSPLRQFALQFESEN